jgi:predicted nucleotidyltransferase
MANEALISAHPVWRRARPRGHRAADQRQLDVSGWDLRKTLQLLRQSNPTLLEWLRSDARYARRRRERAAPRGARRLVASAQLVALRPDLARLLAPRAR